MIVTLPPDLAARLGVATVDVREGEDGLTRIFANGAEVRSLSIADEERVAALRGGRDDLLAMTDRHARDRKQAPVMLFRRKAVHYRRGM